MRKWLPIVLILADLAFAAAVYARLPEQVPSHWNLRGEVDSYSGRLSAVLLLPAITTAMWLLLRALPKVDPRRDHYAKFASSYDAVVLALVAFLVALHVMVLGSALGWPISLPRLVPVGVGLMFMVLGNVLPRARSNWWFGIRTPWTLSNERVWERTHRVGGHLLFAAGVICVVAALLPGTSGMAVVPFVVGAAALASVVYSYFAWKQETSR